MCEVYGESTYSFADDKLRLYPDVRLPDAVYQRVKAAGFRWAPTQELFFAHWSPKREDLLLELVGGEILQEPVTPEERAAERAARFRTYSAHAGERSEAARKRADYIAHARPMGQPILVGHHNERHARADQRRIENAMATSVEEYHKAGHWRNRARAVVKHAARRERSDVVYRRIERLRAQKRECERNLDPAQWLVQSGYPFQPEIPAKGEIREAWERHRSHRRRWLAHLELRIAYEEEVYAASGGLPIDDMLDKLEPGGAVKTRFGWRRIVRINQKRHGGGLSSVSVETPYSWTDKVKPDRIKDVKTRAEIEAALAKAAMEA